MINKLSGKKIALYSRLFSFIKKYNADTLITETHNDVFAKTNCMECANCCKTHSPLFNQKDIERIAKHLKMRPAHFVSKHLLLDDDNDWIFNTTPCPFLRADNTCSIYTVRPQACREYPHTNRKKLYRIKEITLKNAEICPAVTKILDEVVQKLNIQ